MHRRERYNLRLYNLILPAMLISAISVPYHSGPVAVQSKMVESKAEEKQMKITINHKVVDGDIFMECFVPNFNFTKSKDSKQKGEGHLLLYIDGTKISEIYRAAFIIKDLPKGKHKIKVEVVHNDNTPYEGLSEEIEVEVGKE